VSLIDKALQVPHDYFPPISTNYLQDLPILSIFILAYYKIHYLRQAVESVLDQDYQNVELILIDNDAIEDVPYYLEKVYREHPNVALLRFEENQYSWEDITSIYVVFNVALMKANGSYVGCLSYDDKISSNYATKLMQLFIDNPACMTAAPASCSIDKNGEEDLDCQYKNRLMEKSNQRERYIDGFEIAKDTVCKLNRKLFSAFGDVMVINKELVVKNGGYDGLIDFSQVFKFAAFGVTGYDPSAKIFWRHHSEQANRMYDHLRGGIWYAQHKKSWDESGLIELWKDNFDDKYVQLLLEYKKEQIENAPKSKIEQFIRQLWFRIALKGLINIYKECPHLLGSCLLIALKEISKTPYRILRKLISHTLSRNQKLFIRKYILKNNLT